MRRRSESSVYLRFVWVEVFEVDSMVVLDVLECVVHQTAVAAVVAVFSRTVHQVLLAQRNVLLDLSVGLTLQGAGGRESPTRATSERDESIGYLHWK